MRVIFVDMHCVNFLTNTLNQIRGGTRVKTFKHRFLVDYALNHRIEVATIVTGTDTTDPLLTRECNLAKKLGLEFLNAHIKKRCVKEAEFVIKECYGENAAINILSDYSDIRPDDIILGYIFKDQQRQALKMIKVGHKVMMGNHFVALNEGYDLHNANIEAFVNEIDLDENVFVNKYINTSGIKNIVCPYIFANRFIDLGKERKNKAMGVGTLSTCKGNPGYKLYRQEFETEWIQLMRKEIYEHGNNYPEQIDSYISYIYEDKKEILREDNVVTKIYKKVYNRCTGWTQKRYTSFDMVEKFNEYMMFVCPEELVGMPGIGFVEGMACGTAYIGLDTSYYRKLGLIPGKHYISYDGTLSDLINTIKYYQNHTDETRKIAIEGMEYVRKHFNIRVVAMKFYQELMGLL